MRSHYALSPAARMNILPATSVALFRPTLPVDLSFAGPQALALRGVVATAHLATQIPQTLIQPGAPGAVSVGLGGTHGL